ncbi:MAG: UDP-N-acetylmuramate--L-alanine ligase, partial [Gemmatimonadaceae bacterium]|nr:UDP-N-acetylmuramate--L-alanine ligase [Gemmatimonadaceae bacterium]
EDLARLGVPVWAGHDPAHVEGAQAVVVTSAMPRHHPEIERARALGLPVIRRAEALAEAVSGGELVAIAGTHGKTTTTVMTTEALAAAALDPTGVAGGRVGAWSGNLRRGSDALFVVEADEYDRSFLALAPTIAVVTNVEADHLDIYADLADIRRAFAQFVAGARVIVLCADDDGAATLDTPSTAEVVRYGIASPDARLVARDVRPAGAGACFTVVYDDEPLGEVALRVPGRHNVLNALAALASGLALGARVDAMAPGLEQFTGVERRFQRVGEARGVTIVDDYAHHPTEIRATLAAARAAFPGRRLVAAFQPHLYTRTRDFARDFGAALAGADAIFLTEIYPAREQPIDGVSATLIERAAREAGGVLAWRGDRPELAAALARSVRQGDVVLTLGAGDITRTGPELLAHLTDPT